MTLDLGLSPASLQHVIFKLSLMPASLISRSTRSISALPSSEYITQGNMKICSHSPHLSKNPSLQWNCCGTCSASPLPLPHPTTPSLRRADTRVEFPMVPKDHGKCKEFKCSYFNQAENMLCRFVHESQLHVATQLFVGQLVMIQGKKDCGLCKDTPIPTAVKTTRPPKILHRQNLSLDIEPGFSLSFSSNTHHQCRHPSLESSLHGTVAARCAKLRMSATKRSATMRGVDTGSGELRLCRGSSQSACCMVSRTSCLRGHVS